MQPATYNPQPATGNLQPATCNLQANHKRGPAAEGVALRITDSSSPGNPVDYICYMA